MNLTHTYNNRLQPNEFKASSTSGNAIDITYNFVDPVSGKNAGHVYGITNNLDATRSQNFAYDQLNRITSALTTSTYATSPAHCWGENYTLDSWGNLNSIAATTNSAYTGCTIESGFSTTAGGNNHLPIFGYDPSGNTTSDGFVTNYQWDAESQLKSAAGTTYNYDGDGRRVSKVGSKLYWYGSGGDILAETDTCGNTTAEYIFFGGKRIAMIPWSGANCSSTGAGNASYYVEDLLGTSRVLTTNAGVVCYDADFYPYGGERAYTNTCPQNYKFEGKERDTETGNDDFGARYYSNRFGRWLSADWSSVPVPVPYANLTNPQTLNLYSMVADDPESFADLDGHDCDHGNGVNGFPPTEPCRVEDEIGNGEAQYAKRVKETSEQAAQQSTQQSGQNNNQSKDSDKRTDVMLSANSVPPKPWVTGGTQFEMDYKIVPQANTMHQLQDKFSKLQKDSATQANYSKMEVSLWESQRGGKWQWQGDTLKGHGHDVLNVFAQRADQRWYIDGKRTQIVIGVDTKGNLIKAWTVHVEITSSGPKFSKVD